MVNRELRKPSGNLVGILATNVKALRHQKVLSQEELAAKCGLHRTYIGSVERAERNVTLSTLEVLASALDVSVTDLLNNPDHRNGKTTK
jgi:transcriptional regulator with XRE-family HTH domain